LGLKPYFLLRRNRTHDSFIYQPEDRAGKAAIAIIESEVNGSGVESKQDIEDSSHHIGN
jgi:hypothetical protein